jgi:hypothetical protein
MEELLMDDIKEPTVTDLEHEETPADDIDWEAIAREIAEDVYEGFTGGYVEADSVEDDSYNDGFDYYDPEELSEDWNTTRDRHYV